MIIITWSEADVLYVLYLRSSQSIAVDLKTRDAASEWTPAASGPAKSQRILCGKSNPTKFLEGNRARISPNGSSPGPLIVRDCDVVPLPESYSSSSCFNSFGWPSVSACKANIQSIWRTNAKRHSSWLVLDDFSRSVRLDPGDHGYGIFSVQFSAVGELHVACLVFRELNSSIRLAVWSWGWFNIVQNSWTVFQGTNVFTASPLVQWEDSYSFRRFWFENRCLQLATGYT